MPEYIYEHWCPEVVGAQTCHARGSRVTIRPETSGSYYQHAHPLCVYTGMELRLVSMTINGVRIIRKEEL